MFNRSSQFVIEPARNQTSEEASDCMQDLIDARKEELYKERNSEQIKYTLNTHMEKFYQLNKLESIFPRGSMQYAAIAAIIKSGFEDGLKLGRSLT